jgi:hypothetical protein
MNGIEYFKTICQRSPAEYPKGKNGKYQCPCCRYFTLEEYDAYEICPVCFWEDDGAVNDDEFGGPNHMTLGDGRAAYKSGGYKSEHIKAYVREPLESEKEPALSAVSEGENA